MPSTTCLPPSSARVQEEIDRVVGRARLWALGDSAVIHEVERFTDVLPMNLPHRVTQDMTFSGFLISKVR